MADRTGSALVSPLAAHAAPREGESLLERAREVIRLEARSLEATADRLGPDFLRAVELIAAARGRVVVSGIGKSGIVGRKIAATLTSTGTPASFLHPVEGLHGDLGLVGPDDIALLISKSGETEELTGLVEHLARVGVPLVALTGRPRSGLARAAHVALDCSVAEEACPFDLAPTTSTTVTLAVGDALAVALLLRKGFTREDFARLHPGGALGRKLTLRVGDVMLTDDLPVLHRSEKMRACIVLLAKKRGTVAVVDEGGRVVGVVTAGDLTRLMERQGDFLSVPVSDVMCGSPKTTTTETLASAVVHQMETHGIMAVPVVDTDRRLVGIVHLHDLLRAGAA